MPTPPELAAAFLDLHLEAPRVVVRSAREADRPMLRAHELNRAIMQHIRDAMPDAEVTRRIDACITPWDAAQGSWKIAVVARRGDGERLGMVAFRVIDYANAQIEVGYRLHPDFHGQGLAYEATATLVDHLVHVARPHKVVAYCTVDNAPSYRLMERLGMQQEGVFREHAWLDGRWQDDTAYGLLAREWVSPDFDRPE